MDKALELKIRYENKEIETYQQAESFLNDSDLYKSLLADFLNLRIFSMCVLLKNFGKYASTRKTIH